MPPTLDQPAATGPTSGAVKSEKDTFGPGHPAWTDAHQTGYQMGMAAAKQKGPEFASLPDSGGNPVVQAATAGGGPAKQTAPEFPALPNAANGQTVVPAATSGVGMLPKPQTPISPLATPKLSMMQPAVGGTTAIRTPASLFPPVANQARMSQPPTSGQSPGQVANQANLDRASGFAVNGAKTPAAAPAKDSYDLKYAEDSTGTFGSGASPTGSARPSALANLPRPRNQKALYPPVASGGFFKR